MTMMGNKVQLLTTIGVLFLVIGSSFLVCTLYRSTSTHGVTIGSFVGNNPMFAGPNPLSPRNCDVRLEFNYYDESLGFAPISSVDFYLLDSKYSELWLSDGVIDPVWSTNINGDIVQVWEKMFSEGVIDPVWVAKGVSSTDTLHMKIPHRGDYFYLVINPDGSNIAGFFYPKLYGCESDLLWFSITALAIGLVIKLFSKLVYQSKSESLSNTVTVGLKKDDNISNNSGEAVLLSQKGAVLGVSSVKCVSGGLRFGGSLRRLLVWELEKCFVFPMLEVILVIAFLTVLTPEIVEVSSVFGYNNLLSGIQPIFLFLIFIAGVLFCHSYAGSLSSGETKMVLSYPVQRRDLFLSKFIALFGVLSAVYVGVFTLQIPLLALNPLDPLFYVSMLLVLLQLFLVCTISTALSVVTKNEVFSILASALLLFGVESVVSGEGLVTFTGRFTAGFNFVRQYFHGGWSSVTMADVLISVFVMLSVSILLFIFSYVYFTRKMEID
jgi:ABC-type transport system involved in multi-copper enzyme maturation permease subunit